MRRVLKITGLILILTIVLSLLAAIPIGSSLHARALAAQTRLHLQSMQVACDVYYKSFGAWPASRSDFYHNRSNIVFVPRPESQTNDAWGRPIVFTTWNSTLGYGTLLSYGRDGRPGGTGLDADIEFRFGTNK